jgi:phenylalanyl-tRNA synthetase beta chain
VRAPLSWLREFAPFGDDVDALRRTLDDLGLVVESVERVGEGLADVVVARVEEISAIAGADRIRKVVVEAGDGPLEIVCGADNFAVGDLVPLAPVGAVLPGEFEITRRTMRGVVSNGMLCSGRELGLSEDGAGLLVLDASDGAGPGTALAEALGVEADVVFDITVEGNRPDAWSIAGIARDLAARLGLAFSLPEPPDPDGGGDGVAAVASLTVQSPELCPRMTVRVLTGVTVGPSPDWIARCLTLAGMRPINNVVDASNYVMLETGQPTHPYDLDRLPGGGLLVRAARPGEELETLDGVTRTLGVPGRGLGDTGPECLICDAEGTPVGIGGVMGGASSEISEATSRVLLETAYFTPMAIARTSKRLGLRTEASARFERGCDPGAIDHAAARFCALLGGSATVVPGVLDVQGEVPRPFDLEVPVARVNGLLGSGFDAAEIAAILTPIGFVTRVGDAGTLHVTVPTNRPDVRPAPYGVDDVIEEVARSFGYSRLARRQPAWPQPGGLTRYQSDRRLVRDVLCGLGASEAWTPTFVSERDRTAMGLGGPAVEVANPLVSDERFLRRSLLPGLVRAVAYNTDRRQGAVRLFEVGTVFEHPDHGGGRLVGRAGSGGTEAARLPDERELLSVVFALDDDDARTAAVAWGVLAGALRLAEVSVVAGPDGPAPDDVLVGLHPTRSARLMSRSGAVIGAVGEIDPDVLEAFGVDPAPARRVGWLAADLGLLLDEELVPRRSEASHPVSRFPSSDVDLALVVDDTVPAARVAATLSAAGGELLESVTLFDVFRGPTVGEGHRSLAFRLRFCALDRTLTDAEVGRLRASCIEAAQDAVGARLR